MVRRGRRVRWRNGKESNGGAGLMSNGRESNNWIRIIFIFW